MKELYQDNQPENYGFSQKEKSPLFGGPSSTNCDLMNYLIHSNNRAKK
jgi:hypothetical protein